LKCDIVKLLHQTNADLDKSLLENPAEIPCSFLLFLKEEGRRLEGLDRL
jgi:hypothetical protein